MGGGGKGGGDVLMYVGGGGWGRMSNDNGFVQNVLYLIFIPRLPPYEKKKKKKKQFNFASSFMTLNIE